MFLPPKTSSITPSALHRLVGFRTSAYGRDDCRPRRIPLPDGVWLNPRDHNYDVLYGSTFVIQRDRVGGPGLILSNRDWDVIQVWNPSTPTDLVALEQPGQLQRFEAGPLVVDFIDVPATAIGADPNLEESTSCTALVFAGTSQDDGSNVGSSMNPRRTRKMQFTCNRCHTRNTNFVNPHAWKNGVVFCRCEGCKIVHLIRDEKNIFWAPAAATSQNEALKIPNGLIQIPEVPGGTVGGMDVL